MKRFHVHVHVEDLAQSVAFYSKLFAAGQPSLSERLAMASQHCWIAGSRSSFSSNVTRVTSMVAFMLPRGAAANRASTISASKPTIPRESPN